MEEKKDDGLTEETKQKLTLAQRIERLADLPIKPKSIKLKPHAVQPPLLESDKEFCIICKCPRLDGDLTGLICGQTNCLIGLGKLFTEIEREIKFLAKNYAGLQKEVLEKCLDISDEILPQVGLMISDTRDSLYDILKIMGIDEENWPEELNRACDLVKEEITKIQIALEKIEKRKD